ncbi:NUDIX hydrolase [Photobacterium sp. DNB23_23_1]|uniref:NUDIX domain-containing protein n=1 Tax=Photobacterium pectinilyticum TaxID=2906793 RepID=A0ABT1NC91_9GAMM|nr:NUDIX domain-containing protein [Photobacterium sp. ZSDE20]MCQ1060954.1 NUDIX domain-containing protein [Photobacterium sp. ZSDE20]MDD1828890.1 NUDIX domain-containing protein [Photobacterium sp. ZSDE20]
MTTQKIPINTSIVSGVALSEIDGEMKMLLMKRVKGGYWCHVAGSIEGQEKGWQAIVRECFEETQITVSELYNAQFLEQFFEANVNVIQIIPVFVVLCPPNQPITLNEEHTEYRWVGLDEAKALVPFPGQRQVYDHVWTYFVDNAPSTQMKVNIS